MQRYILRRLLSFIVVLIGVSILSFLLIALSGKDPAEIIAHMGSTNPTEEQLSAIREEFGLSNSLPVRYINWMKGLFTGDMGLSLTTRRPIAEDLARFMSTSLSLVGISIVWIIVLTLPLSLLSARYRDSIFDQITRGITIFGICIPTFWLGFMMLMFFAVRLKWFSVLPGPGISKYILPSLSLAIPSACSLIRLMRSVLLSELSSDHVQFEKARGLSSRRILMKHILRNSLPPIITIFFQQFGFLLAGSAVVESVFSIKGIGTWLVESVMNADTIAVSTCIVFIAFIFVTSNLIADILNRILCPAMARGEDD